MRSFLVIYRIYKGDKEEKQLREEDQQLREIAQQQRDEEQQLCEIAEAKVEEQAAELEKLRQQLGK